MGQAAEAGGMWAKLPAKGKPDQTCEGEEEEQAVAASMPKLATAPVRRYPLARLPKAPAARPRTDFLPTLSAYPL